MEGVSVSEVRAEINGSADVAKTAGPISCITVPQCRAPQSGAAAALLCRHESADMHVKAQLILGSCSSQQGMTVLGKKSTCSSRLAETRAASSRLSSSSRRRIASSRASALSLRLDASASHRSRASLCTCRSPCAPGRLVCELAKQQSTHHTSVHSRLQATVLLSQRAPMTSLHEEGGPGD